MKVDEALKELGNITIKDLADKLQVTRQAVFYWKQNGLPRLRQYQIKELLDDSKRGNISEIQQGL
tara:strand:- start:340 stop:534 length:195 start_codon:yes stop_codon:yes gene_type:complete